MNMEREDIITDEFLDEVVREINELYGWQPNSLEDKEENEKTAKEN
ncbi:MAG: bacitracin ABC transporter ATP-binding protein [Bacillus sp. (in: firmicutes)]